MSTFWEWPFRGLLGTSWWLPIVFLVIAGHATNVCISLFLHRSQTHRALRLKGLAQIAMRIWLWLSTSIKTKEWVAVHRRHHAFADLPGDPHSPKLEGLFNIVVKGYFYYRRAANDPALVKKYGRGTPNDWLERHLVGRLSWLGIVSMLALDMLLFGAVIGALVWLGQIVWVPFWAAGVVNGVGHAAGYRTFAIKGTSRNIFPLAVLLGGEELHNNHHADPGSARFRARWFELDIGWVYIRVLALLGLAQLTNKGKRRLVTV